MKYIINSLPIDSRPFIKIILLPIIFLTILMLLNDQPRIVNAVQNKSSKNVGSKLGRTGHRWQDGLNFSQRNAA